MGKVILQHKRFCYRVLWTVFDAESLSVIPFEVFKGLKLVALLQMEESRAAPECSTSVSQIHFHSLSAYLQLSEEGQHQVEADDEFCRLSWNAHACFRTWVQIWAPFVSDWSADHYTTSPCSGLQSTEERLDGQHQRADIPAHARTAQNWKRISAESSILFPRWPSWSMDWTEMNNGQRD